MKLFSKIKDNPLLSFLIFLLVLAFGAFVGVLFCECIETHISNLLGLSNKNETLKFLGIGMGGILIALQALMSYQRAKAMEKTAEAQADAANAQARATEEQAKANQHTEQGQQQERFRNAIEHLGHKSDSVRLGGAYELFHLVQDTPETPELRQTVHDILCAHIRQTTGEKEYREKHKSKPSEEVQSLLNLLFVQEHEVFKGCHINLQGSWLKGVALKRARLENAILVGVQLQRADLRVVQLQGADLSEAKMQEATLRGVQLQRATFWAAQMQGASLSGVQLQAATLREVKMQGAILRGVKMQGADLSDSELQGATLQAVLLQGAILRGVKMQGAITGNGGSFEERIKRQIYRESELTGVIFEGKLSQEVVDSIVADFSDGEDEAEREILRKILRERLMSHVGKPESYELPENSGAITGTYTEEDAEKWIAEYNEAMSSVPEEDAD